MATNEDFAKFLVKTNPQNSAARLALYNYIKNFSDLSCTFDSEFLVKFFRSCFTHEYWRKEKKELFHETQNSVERFCELFETEFKMLLRADKMQILSIENKSDQNDVIQNFLSRNGLESSTTMVDSDGQICLIQTLPNQKIKVHVFDNLFLIYEGNLEPLCYDQNIIYDSRLEIEKNVFHNIKVIPHILGQFKIGHPRIEISYIQGPFFKKIKSHSVENLIDDKQLYFSLKKLERYFIDPTSDPSYLEVVSKLEEALYLLEAHGERALEFAQNAFEIGENFYTKAFPDDKMLSQLISDIRQGLNNLSKKGVQWNPSGSINLLPKTVL